MARVIVEHGFASSGSATDAWPCCPSGGAAVFNGNAGTYLKHGSVSAYPSGSSSVTLEAWVKLASSSSGAEIVGYGANSATGSRDGLSWSGSSLVQEFENLGVGASLPFDTNWHHLVSVYGGGPLATTSDYLYVDGVSLSTGTGGGTPAITTTELKIGGIPTVTFCCALNGSVDEVRVSAGVRSADWIKTEYNNQSSPSTFYSIGQETP